MSDLLENEIREHFSSSREHYAYRKGCCHGAIDRIILDFLSVNIHRDARILEVGGGSGYMLDLIAREIGVSELVNCEYVADIYRNQANPDTSLVKGDVLQIPFGDSSFDLVLSVNLLHHLVSKSVKATRENQSLAIGEISRVVAREGFVVILEQCYTLTSINSLLFYILKGLSNINVDLSWIGVGRKLVVCFLDYGLLHKMIDSSGVLTRQFTWIIPDRPQTLAKTIRLLPAYMISPPYNLIIFSKRCR